MANMTEDCNKTQKTKKNKGETEGKKQNPKGTLAASYAKTAGLQLRHNFFEKKKRKKRRIFRIIFVSFAASAKAATESRTVCVVASATKKKEKYRFVFCSFFARVGLVSKFYEIW